MITAADILNDSQVAKLLGISLDTLQKRMNKGFKPGELDLAQARPMIVGGMRRWFRADVEKVIKERLVKA